MEKIWVTYISTFGQRYIKSYNKKSDKGCFFEIHVQTSQWFTVFTLRMKIKKVEKLVATLHDKIKYVINVRNF